MKRRKANDVGTVLAGLDNDVRGRGGRGGRGGREEERKRRKGQEDQKGTLGPDKSLYQGVPKNVFFVGEGRGESSCRVSYALSADVVFGGRGGKWSGGKWRGGKWRGEEWRGEQKSGEGGEGGQGRRVVAVNLTAAHSSSQQIASQRQWGGLLGG